MNCELAHERIVLAAYSELPDEQVHELDRHLAACTECSQERQQLQALKTLATAYPVVEPDPNFVTRSRIRLEESLDAIPPKRWFERFGQRGEPRDVREQRGASRAIRQRPSGGQRRQSVDRQICAEQFDHRRTEDPEIVIRVSTYFASCAVRRYSDAVSRIFERV